MRIDNRIILIAIVAITLITLLIVLFTSGTVRIGAGIILACFFPGYTLISSLFPKSSDLSLIERLSLSLGASIIIIALLGLILNYTPWGIQLYPVLISTVSFILITAALGYYRQQLISIEQRFCITIKSSYIKQPGTKRIERVLSILIAISIFTAISCLIYTIAKPKVGERFTEFYILNSKHVADDYPIRISNGTSVNITLGIINHEQITSSYRVTVKIDDISIEEIDLGQLAPEGKYEKEIQIIPKKMGNNQRLEFILYKNGSTQPYFKDQLHLNIDVIGLWRSVCTI
jgi:uncharacterized membrane protein